MGNYNITYTLEVIKNFRKSGEQYFWFVTWSYIVYTKRHGELWPKLNLCFNSSKTLEKQILSKYFSLIKHNKLIRNKASVTPCFPKNTLKYKLFSLKANFADWFTQYHGILSKWNSSHEKDILLLHPFYEYNILRKWDPEVSRSVCLP